MEFLGWYICAKLRFAVEPVEVGVFGSSKFMFFLTVLIGPEVPKILLLVVAIEKIKI